MSSAFCDIAMVLHLTFGGVCAEQGPAPDPVVLPDDDESVWAVPHMPDPPPPPAPKAEPVSFPPVVIKVPVATPAAPPPAPPAPAPVKEPPKVDPYRAALEATYAAAATGAHRAPFTSSAVPVSLTATEGKGATVPGMGRQLAPDPLAAQDLPEDPEDYTGERRTSSLPVDNSRIVTADRYISVQLETGINSQVGGEATGTVILQTTRPVFGYHGRYKLIPEGSRLICDYMPPEDMGSSRLAINCERILLGRTRVEIRNLGSGVSNQQGWQGASGEVERRFWERYGNAFMLTGISTAVRYAAATSKSEDEDGEVATAAAEKAAEELSTKFGEITANILEETLSLKPIITIPQGTRLQIRPATDWYIEKME